MAMRLFRVRAVIVTQEMVAVKIKTTKNNKSTLVTYLYKIKTQIIHNLPGSFGMISGKKISSSKISKKEVRSNPHEDGPATTLL